MHKNVNQLKMGTLLSYLTIAIQNISAIIYTPLMLRFLGQNEYGLYQLGEVRPFHILGCSVLDSAVRT